MSIAEFRSIEREYALIRPLATGHSLPRALRDASRGCAVLGHPNTRLIDLVREDCHDAIGFFRAFAKISAADTDCTRGPQNAVVSCVAKRFADLSLQLRREADNGVRLNAELRRRGIAGLCALSVGIRPSDLALTRTASAAATDAANAAVNGNADAFAAAQSRVTAALRSGSPDDPLAGIRRACRPRKARVAPKPKVVPRRHRRASGGIKA